MAVESVRETYDRTAAFYDQVTEADDYGRWVSLYLRLLQEHGVTAGRLADLGCGTGKASVRLAAHGFDVTGVDLSPEMLRVARLKPGSEGIRYVTGDLRRLPEGLGEFDVAVTFGEPLNYLADETELLDAFESVAEILAPDGLFVFDLNTSGFYERIGTVRAIDEYDDMLVLQRGSSSERGADLRVDHFLPDDQERWTRMSVVHSWAYFPPARVEELLLQAGLVQVADHGLTVRGLTNGSDEKTDRKRLIVARAQMSGPHDGQHSPMGKEVW
ncbi:class I SAM-dependent DNA methyltransferase [Lentzea sp. NPDC051213]|uniref:class I SAM-dependent DNA methyltransferase n=1 Tax=Lentzea sp. NPDC051213 TaxID=3364126 RepID=UPI0037AFC1CA